MFVRCFAAVEMTSVCQSGNDDKVSANKAAVREGDHSGEKPQHVADPRDLETNMVGCHFHSAHFFSQICPSVCLSVKLTVLSAFFYWGMLGMG